MSIHLVEFPVSENDNNNGLIWGAEIRSDEDKNEILNVEWFSTKEEALEEVGTKITAWSLNIEWMDGEQECMNNDMPEYLKDQIQKYLSELEDLRAINEGDGEDYSYSQQDAPVNIHGIDYPGIVIKEYRTISSHHDVKLALLNKCKADLEVNVKAAILKIEAEADASGKSPESDTWVDIGVNGSIFDVNLTKPSKNTPYEATAYYVESIGEFGHFTDTGIFIKLSI